MATESTNSIPIIDFEPFLHDDDPNDVDVDIRRKKVAQDVYKACTEVGFFYLCNHGVGQEQLADIFNKSKWFFSLPMEIKQSVRWAEAESNRGYTAVEVEKCHETMPGDLKEAFNVGVEGDEKFPNLWPQHHPPTKEDDEFKSSMTQFFESCHQLSLRVLRAFAMSLGLDDAHFFDDKHNEKENYLRLLRYPALGSTQPKPGQIRAGEHTDYGSLTLLFQDETGGLEVRRRDGQWIAATPKPGCVIINTGDLMMRWTNDVFLSTPHRVVIDASAPHKDRYSIAYFVHPNKSTTINCIVLPASQSQSQSQSQKQQQQQQEQQQQEAKYPPIKAIDYLVQRLKATY